MHTCEEYSFQGVHVLGEMYGISPALLDDGNYLRACLAAGIAASGADLCSFQIKQFEPMGVTLLALLSESHASLHTYPEQGSLFFDAFTCGERCQPELIAKVLAENLKPVKVNLQTFRRGQKSNNTASAHTQAGRFLPISSIPPKAEELQNHPA